MIIDRFTEGFSGLPDRDADVLSSPAHLSSFYGCCSPAQNSPNSDSDQSWSDAGSPQNPVDVDARRPGRYQGVRVRRTVKELIMQKRSHEVQAQQCRIENRCPALTHVLNPKSDVENPPHFPVKRARGADGTVLCPYGQAVVCDEEMLEDIGEVLSKERLWVEPVTVGGVSARGLEALLYADAPLLPSTAVSSSSAPVSFFQWQVQQEEDKLCALSHQELTARDGDGDTFLHIAVAQGRRALAYVLARKMAAVDVLDMKEHNNQSAFQLSAAADQHLIAQDLLSLGAELNTADGWGRSPLHVCAEKGHALTLQAIHRAVQTSGRQVNMEVVNYDGLSPLHVAVLSHNAVVQELCSQDQSLALLQRRKLLGECVSTLLLMGASIETKDRKSGRTALHMAAEEANIELLRLFLDQSNSFSVINTKAFNGNTALHVASALQGRQAQADAVRLLLRRGADPSAKNLENEQPGQLVPEGPLGDQVRRFLKGKGAQVRS